MNSSTILTNLRSLPGDVGKTSDQFSRWYHDDVAWTGRWTNSPEGYVDMEDMGLTAEPIVIDIEAKNGVIDGTIATKQICANVPMVNFLLLRGSVDISGANVVAWDIIGGHKRDFAELKLTRDGDEMTVVPTGGAMELFPMQSKMAFDPNKPTEGTEFCEGKSEAMMKLVGELTRKRPSTGRNQ